LFVSSPALSDADIAYQQETLRELGELGMDLARTLRREVFDAPKDARPVSAGDVAMAFSRIARAVRLTLALETRVLTGEPARAGRSHDAAPADDPTLGITRENLPFIPLGAYKKVVARVISDTIIAETQGAEAERLVEALCERLFERDDDEALADLPIGELINRIRTDIGLPALAEPWTEEERSKFRPQIMAAKAAREAQEAQTLADRQRPKPSAGAPWCAKRPAPA
jgi:hypothetical protein